MAITFTSIMTSVFIGTIILAGYFYASKLLNRHKRLTSKLFIMLVFLFLIRITLPGEFGYTISIPSKILMPAVESIFYTPVFSFFGLPVLVLNIFTAIWILGAGKKLHSLFSNYLLLMKIGNTHSTTSDYIDKHDKKIRVLFLSKNTSPRVIGFFRPILILPKQDLTDKEISCIIKDELIQVSNFDLLIKYCYEIVLCCYWWNPVFYLFRDQMNQVLELSANDEAVQELSEDEKAEYVSTLLKVSRQVLIDRERSAYSAAFSGSNQKVLLQRSHNILNEKRTIGETGMILLSSAFLLFSTSVIFEASPADDKALKAENSFSQDNSYYIPAKESRYNLFTNHEFIMNLKDEKSEVHPKELNLYKSGYEEGNR